eukprot:COSAG01_NODE_2771_length_7101_cov_12.982148_5_plen_191_part_00
MNPSHRRVHPQLRGKNRRGIGESQSKWTAHTMQAPGSPGAAAVRGLRRRRRPWLAGWCRLAGRCRCLELRIIHEVALLVLARHNCPHPERLAGIVGGLELGALCRERSPHLLSKARLPHRPLGTDIGPRWVQTPRHGDPIPAQPNALLGRVLNSCCGALTGTANEPLRLPTAISFMNLGKPALIKNSFTA